MLSLSQLTAIAGARGNTREHRSSRAMKSAAQRRPSRYTHGPVVTSIAPQPGDLAGSCPGGASAGACARVSNWPAHAHQVQVRLLFGEQPGAAVPSAGPRSSDHMVPDRIVAGGQLGQPPDCRQAGLSGQVRRLTCGHPRLRRIRGRATGPGTRAGQRSGSSAPVAQPGTAGPGAVRQPRHPLIVEPADPPAHGGRMTAQQFRDLGRR